MSWRVARSLQVLLSEIDAAAPRRSKVSDGSIGDASHASRSSDHNPWVKLNGQGIVRARDFTHDPAGGVDCNDLAKALVALLAKGGHPALRSGAYVIWNRRIYSFDRRSEGWREYTGSNPHNHHLHLSVATAPEGFDSGAAWSVMKDWFDMATKEDLAKLLDLKLAPLQKSLERQRDVDRGRFDKIRRELDALASDQNADATEIKSRLKEVAALATATDG